MIGDEDRGRVLAELADGRRVVDLGGGTWAVEDPGERELRELFGRRVDERDESF